MWTRQPRSLEGSTLNHGRELGNWCKFLVIELKQIISLVINLVQYFVLAEPYWSHILLCEFLLL